ncbi:MAG TPA: protein kinase, partial [Labilithrix sp.]
MDKVEGTGERIGGYRVVRRLATGGTSDVLLAKAEGPHGFERTVVLKILLSQYKHDEEIQRMFAREAAAYARLSHPSIVRLFDFFALEGQLVMVLEFVDGPPLSRLRGMLKAVGQPLEDKAAIYIAQRLFDALAAAHAATDDAGGPAPVIHRDVNPTNILVPWEGHVKLADFGVAKVTGSTHQSTAGLIKGTFGYMAPEQVTGDTVTPRADVYAGAIVLWEMLTKRRAFQRGALPEIEVLRVMAEPKIVSLDVLRPDIDRNVREAVRRALEPKPERRMMTAEEMVQILREAVPSEDGREVLAKALAAVRHEPKPQYSVPPNEMTPVSSVPIGLVARAPEAERANPKPAGPPPVPRPGQAKRTLSWEKPIRAPLPKVTPPPMGAVTAAMIVAKTPAPPSGKPTAPVPAPSPADDERPTQIPMTSAPSTQPETPRMESHVNAPGIVLKDAIDEILRSVPSSLPPQISSELPKKDADSARDIGMIPAAPAAMNAAPNGFDSVDQTLLMSSRPPPAAGQNPDALATVVPGARTSDQPQAHAITAPMPKYTPPLPREAPTPAIAMPMPAAALPPQQTAPMFPSSGGSSNASATGSFPQPQQSASYRGAISSVAPEAPDGVPTRRSGLAIFGVLVFLIVTGGVGTAVYLQRKA